MLLREHYRCHPDVAAWLNRTFYDGQLQVLTPAGRLRGPVQGLQWVSVTGTVERADGGGVVNRAEARLVVERLVALPPDLLSPSDGGPGGSRPVSVGIVTPFAG